MDQLIEYFAAGDDAGTIEAGAGRLGRTADQVPAALGLAVVKLAIENPYTAVLIRSGADVLLVAGGTPLARLC